MGYAAEDLIEYATLSDAELSQEIQDARGGYAIISTDLVAMRRNGASWKEIEDREWDRKSVFVAIRKMLAVQASRKAPETVYYRNSWEQDDDGEWNLCA